MEMLPTTFPGTDGSKRLNTSASGSESCMIISFTTKVCKMISAETTKNKPINQYINNSKLSNLSVSSPWSEIQVDQPHSIQQEYCWKVCSSTCEKILNLYPVFKVNICKQNRQQEMQNENISKNLLCTVYFKK